MNRKFTIVVKPTTSKLHADDQDVPGEYDILLNRNLDDDVIASAVLDVFHHSVPIKNLEDFSLTVYRSYDAKIMEEHAVEQSFFDAGALIERRELY